MADTTQSPVWTVKNWAAYLKTPWAMIVAILLLVAGGLATMMIDNSRLNRSQQMTSEVRANAQNCLTLVVQKLRSAGWDPLNAGFAPVALDPNLGDAISQIEVFADRNLDGDSGDPDEQILIRHNAGRVEWRPTADPTAPFVVLATNITNDADGDGTIEPMFQPDSLTSPTRITVTVTARSADPDPLSGEFVTFTASTDVTLRGAL